MTGDRRAVAAVPLERYGFIGDLHTAALVADDGSVDWFCAPRFDSPSLFGALLDRRIGGCWRISPAGASGSHQRYVEGTNVLQTVFQVEPRTEVIVTDFLPVGAAREGTVELHRIVQCASGSADIDIRFQPAFDYAQRPGVLEGRTHGWLATDRAATVVALSAPPDVRWTPGDGAVDGRTALRAGDRLEFVLRFDRDEVLPLDACRSGGKLAETIAWWREWLAHLRYQGPYRDHVARSALALKLCCYAPTGAIVAAPTTSLPETPGGSRNWDYRYVWLRDAAFVLYALERSGYTAEVDAFSDFLKRVCRHADGKYVQVMYDLDGGRDLPERELTHLEGYGGARPVRIGNGAAGQFQLDVYGEVLQTLQLRHRRQAPSEGLWSAARALVEWTAAHWREPDWSIWEARGEPRHYVFSKVMAWTALDRGAAIAQRSGLPGDVAHWRREADLLREEVLRRGWDERRGTFVQAFDEQPLDAAVLVMPKVRFLARDDPRFRSTLDAVRRELGAGSDELIYRYNGSDGLPGSEGAFVICSFWLVQGLAMSGRFAEAEDLYRRLLARATPLGLFGEEIDPATGAHLGNFPQAFSHAALINSAQILERLRPGAGPAAIRTAISVR